VIFGLEHKIFFSSKEWNWLQALDSELLFKLSEVASEVNVGTGKDDKHKSQQAEKVDRSQKRN